VLEFIIFSCWSIRSSLGTSTDTPSPTFAFCYERVSIERMCELRAVKGIVDLTLS
jgi:hypothetical protein